MNLTQKAIPFIIKNQETQLYEMSSQAQNFLNNINSNLCIISVAGLYRTGKSYLLNRVVLNKGQGFNVGPTINPCTKGLWIWNQPIHTQDNKQVLVIDTEGLGALDEQANHDMKIFSLAVLLSTTFIYNSVGNIDENALQTLSLVLNLVGNIDNEKQSSRPSFIWVVRDFSLQLIDQKGNTISPKQYLQMALNSEHVKQSQKVQIRKNITNSFGDRDCFTLFKPLIDQNKLQKLDLIPIEQLRPEFVRQTMDLRKKIFSNLSTIKLSNSQLKGKQYVMMVKKYLQAINNGKVPNLLDTWTFIKQQRTQQISQSLIETYTQKIKTKFMSKMPMKFVYLEELFNGLWTELEQQFFKLTYEDSSTEQLKEFFQRIKYQIKISNEEQMKIFLKNLLTKQYEVFSKKIYSDYYHSIQQFLLDIDKNFKQSLVMNYSQKVEGLNASILSFLQKKYFDVFKYFSSKLKLEIKKINQNKQELQDSYKREIQTLKNNSKHYQSQLNQKIINMDKIIIQLTRKNEEIQRFLQMQKQENKDKIYQSKNKLSQLQQTLTQYGHKNYELDQRKKQIEKQMFMMRKQSDKEIALIRQRNQYLTKQNEQIQKRYQDMKKLLDQKMFVQDQERKKYFLSNQQKFKNMAQQNQQKSDKIFQLQHKLMQLNEEFNEKCKKMQIKERKLIQDKQKMKQNLINDFSNKKESHSHQLNSLRDQCRKCQDQLEIVSLQKSQLQQKVKLLSEEVKHSKYSAQKQIAIHMQRIQFYQVQIKQLKYSYQQSKKNYQSQIENINYTNKGIQQKNQARIKQITEQNCAIVKNMEKQFNQKIYQIKKQLQIFKTTRQQLQIQLSLQKKKIQSKQKQFKESYSKLQSLYKNIHEKHTNSQKDFHDLNQQKQTYFSMRIKQLEKQVQQIKQKSSKQLQQTQRSSQQALAILKNYTEMERHQWEKRLQDEKQKNNRNIQNLKNQFQKKIYEQKQALEEENSILQQKIDQMQRLFNQTFQNMKYDHDIQVQKLSNQFTEQKVQINKKNALITQQMNLTKLNMQNQLDQAKRSYECNIMQIKKQLQNQLKQQQMKYKQEKQFLESKLQSLKKANKSVEQQNLILKNELDKEKALYKEKQNGHLKNINDLEEKLSYELFNHTKTIEEITNANSLERKRLNGQIDSLKAAKSTLEEENSKLGMEKESVQSKLNSQIVYWKNKKSQSKNEYDDLMNKFELTTGFLNNKIKTMQKQKEELNSKLKAEFQQQIGMKEDNYKKQNKQYNDRIYRLQTQNKSLRDKVIYLEVKLTSSQSKSNMVSESSEFEKMQQMKEQYLKREQEYRGIIEKQKKEIKKLKQQNIKVLTNDFERSRISNNGGYNNKEYNRDSSERQSIINGLNQNSRIEASRSRVNLDNSKMLNTSTVNNQSRINVHNVLQENRNKQNLINRKMNPSPIIMNKKHAVDSKSVMGKQHANNNQQRKYENGNQYINENTYGKGNGNQYGNGNGGQYGNGNQYGNGLSGYKYYN